jgi:hypothetical protein
MFKSSVRNGFADVTYFHPFHLMLIAVSSELIHVLSETHSDLLGSASGSCFIR